MILVKNFKGIWILVKCNITHIYYIFGPENLFDQKLTKLWYFLKKEKKIFEWLQNLNLFSVNKKQTKDRKLSFLAAVLFIITFQIHFWLFFYKWLLQFDQIDNNGVKACIKFESIKIIFTCLAYFLPPRIATGTGIN